MYITSTANLSVGILKTQHRNSGFIPHSKYNRLPSHHTMPVTTVLVELIFLLTASCTEINAYIKTKSNLKQFC